MRELTEDQKKIGPEPGTRNPDKVRTSLRSAWNLEQHNN